MLQTCRIAYVKSPILSSQPIMVTFTRAIHKSHRMRFLITRLPATAMPFTSTQIFTSSAGCLARRHICTTSTQMLATDINLHQGQAIISTNTHRMSQRQAISHTPSTAIHSSAVGRARVGYGPHIHGKRTRKHFYTERLMPWKTQEEVTEMLKDNIVYQDDYLVAINKPNQLPIHALKYSEFLPLDIPPPEAAELSVQASLKPLAEHFGVDELHKSLSQDRLHSGIIVLAKHKEVVGKLQKYFRHVQAQNVLAQKFWVITVGTPHPAHGQEAFPVERVKLQDRLLSVKSENPSGQKRQAGKMIVPKVSHTTLDFNQGLNAALVQIEPSSTKWDLLQLYCMHKLSPILGDTVYSSRVHFVSGQPVLMGTALMRPGKQALSVELQRALDLDSGKDVLMPLHVHCAELRLPDFERKRRYVTVTASPPDTFVWTLESLKLRIPPQRTEQAWTLDS